MIHLTSDLDFKLTKKRFQMMGRTFSKKRTRLVLSVILPTLAITTLVFCTKYESPENRSLGYMHLYQNSEPFLYSGRTDGLIYSRNNEEYELFSGTQRSRNPQTNLIKFERVIQEGILYEVSTFDSLGDLESITAFTYTGPEEEFAEPGSIKERLAFNADSVLERKAIFEYPGPDKIYSKSYDIVNGTDVLTGEGTYFFSDDSYEVNILGYYENGDLEMEYVSTRDSTHLETRMTEWNEEGNILRFEHKVNGEIVKEINNGEEG